MAGRTLRIKWPPLALMRVNGAPASGNGISLLEHRAGWEITQRAEARFSFSVLHARATESSVASPLELSYQFQRWKHEDFGAKTGSLLEEIQNRRAHSVEAAMPTAECA
ncbi:MAG: hypothetical protein HYY24_08375 [Verrucomicrobia bacterium]|nr:hypothetical protein [Verrucomicrobiota bacterium]